MNVEAYRSGRQSRLAPVNATAPAPGPVSVTDHSGGSPAAKRSRAMSRIRRSTAEINATSPRRRRRERLPARDDARPRPSLSIVGNGREQAAQLDRSRKLAAVLEGCADRGGLVVGDGEHAPSMGGRAWFAQNLERHAVAVTDPGDCAMIPTAAMAGGNA